MLHSFESCSIPLISACAHGLARLPAVRSYEGAQIPQAIDTLA